MNIELLYNNFRKYMSLLFETFTFRTKPQYQPCNEEDPQEVYFRDL